jgi:uncharacterized protein YkwD
MTKLSRSYLLAGACILVSACGGDDSGDDGRTGSVDSPNTSCITLTGQTCGCPGGGYGVFACDGSCTMCPASTGGRSGSVNPPAAGAAPAGTGAMRPAWPLAGAGAAGVGAPAGPAGTGAAGMMPRPPAAGSGGAPVAGSAGGMAGMAGMGAAGGGGTVTGDVPDSSVCAPVASWSAEWAGFEQEVLRLVNENRAKGWNCDTMGMFPAAGPLAMNPFLRCSARLHSKDMAERMFFAHDNPDGENPGTRMREAGYVGRGWGENIAQGQRSPAEVVQGWMDSDGHCSNIMNAMFNQIGVGYFAGMSTNPRWNSALYWTQNFGATAQPRP